MSPTRVAFVGGGSGGDAHPLLAVARALQVQRPEVECLFFCTADGIGERIYGAAGFSVAYVVARRLYWKNLPWLPFTLARGIRSGRHGLADFDPGLLVAIGGFVSPPLVLAACSLGIPVVLLEVNSRAGRANRGLAHFVELVITGYESAAKSLPDPSRVECLGVPLRFEPDEEVRKARRAARPPGERCLTISGGSLGARVINRAVAARYEELAAREQLRVVHVTGRANLEECREAWDRAGRPGNIELRGYEEDMERLYQEADLMICRAGATTCQELAVFRVPALLVPLGLAPYDHQYWNAHPLEEAGAAEILREAALSPAALLARVDAWLADPAAFEARREAYRGLFRPGAATRVAERLLGRLDPAGTASDGAGLDRSEGPAVSAGDGVASNKGGGAS